MAVAPLFGTRIKRAKIKRIDTKKASPVPGVFTGQDFADINPLPCARPTRIGPSRRRR